MSKTIDTTELKKIVVGRVDPHIYSFETNTLPNYLKVGDTYRSVEERLDEWRRHYKDLKEVSRHKATIDDEVFFRDYSVHKYLQQKGIKQVPLDIAKNVHSNEFFKGARKNDVANAITNIVESYNKNNVYEYYNHTKDKVEYHFKRTKGFKPRENQQQVINNFKKAVRNGRNNLLMYAVMRFGKSITSMWSAKAIKSKLTVIVSAKADVKSEWKETVESHKDFTGYRFLDAQDLKKDIELTSLYGKTFNTANGEEICTSIVLFFTLQDLAGSTAVIKNHHKILKELEIDLLVIDETHFGARAQVLGKILAGVDIEEHEKDLLKKDKEDNVNLGQINKLEAVNSKVKLHLSGTPYRILMGSEFEPQDIVAFVQFSDIYNAKLDWSREHLDVDEWLNPYYGFPQMVRFAFNPNESARKKLESIAGSKPAELFTPVSTNTNGDYERFLHQSEVLDLLAVLDGSKTDSHLLGLLNNESIKNGKLARHIVMVLPYCASCDALEKLINQNKDKFKNLSEYLLLNVSGHNKTIKDPGDAKIAIAEAESTGQKTITLTVNKMLTGTTVSQWDTMIYLKNTLSPQEYDQAIFRLQTPWVEKYKDSNGNSVKRDMKPQTLLVDLDPTRLFYLQEKKAFSYGVNTAKVGNEHIEAFLKQELQISPIITTNAENNKLVKVTATNIIDQVRQYTNERSITEDVQEIGIDLMLKDNQYILEFINRLAELDNKNGLSIKPVEGEGEDMYGEPTENDTEENDTPQTDTTSIDESISSFEKRFRTYYVMILLFSFLSNTDEKSLTDVIKNMNSNANNRRVAANLGLVKKDLELIKKHLNPIIRTTLDYKIQNASYRASDVNISLAEHIDVAIHKFKRLSDAEVFTPSHIVNKMYDAFNEEFWNQTKDNKILDIASKSGVFAKGFVERAVSQKFNLRDIQNNFYSIPTSPVAYEFTRKMYEALGLNVDNIARHFTSFDFVQLDTEQQHILLAQNMKFCDLKLTNLKKTGKIKYDMKFTAVVGNPPYQESVEGNTRTAPIYNHFIDAAQKVSDVVCLIHPARFLFDAGQTPKAWNKKMLNDPHLSVIFYEQSSSKLFPNTDIKGGVSVTLWDKNKNNGGLGGKFVPIEELDSILKKVDGGGFEKIVFVNTAPAYPINPKRPKDKKIRSNAFTELPKMFKDKPDKDHTIKIIGVINNVRTEKFVPEKIIDDPVLKKWKVFLPESNGSGKLGEVLSTPFVAKPGVGCAQTFIQIGSFSTESEANNCIKYLKTKFCRTLLGTLKVTQHNPKGVWKNIPLQDFTKKSNIDWSKSIFEIDKQLYKKYKLNKQEIDFIEKNVKPMK